MRIYGRGLGYYCYNTYKGCQKTSETKTFHEMNIMNSCLGDLSLLTEVCSKQRIIHDPELVVKLCPITGHFSLWPMTEQETAYIFHCPCLSVSLVSVSTICVDQ